MPVSTRSRWTVLSRTAIGFCCVLELCGCGTPSLTAARRSFYRGDLETAQRLLADEKPPPKDRVLFLMERGTIYQSNGAYAESSRDFIEAANRLRELETYSLSQGSASLVVNDTTQDFRGVPFERTFLHTLTALNHLALGHWNHVGVEARRIMESLSDDVRKEYPDDAFSRYVAGFCLEVMDDSSNAAMQYRRAARLASHLSIDDQTGYINIVSNRFHRPTNELVCFVLMGRPADNDGSPYVEFYHQDTYLGRSYNLADTRDLIDESERIEAPKKAVKTAARVAIKEGIAHGLESASDSPLIGALTHLILIGLPERPDSRRWETLPRRLQVARVPCPSTLSAYRMVYKNANGQTLKSEDITQPITKYRNTYISFCRSLSSPP